MLQGTGRHSWVKRESICTAIFISLPTDLQTSLPMHGLEALAD